MVKSEKIIEKNSKKNEIQEGLTKLSEELSRTNVRIEEILEIQKNIIKHNNAIGEHNATIRAINTYIGKLNTEVGNLMIRKGSIIDENVKLNELKQELKELLKKQEELSIEKQYYEYAASLLKDTGIKTKIIQRTHSITK